MIWGIPIFGNTHINMVSLGNFSRPRGLPPRPIPVAPCLGVEPIFFMEILRNLGSAHLNSRWNSASNCVVVVVVVVVVETSGVVSLFYDAGFLPSTAWFFIPTNQPGEWRTEWNYIFSSKIPSSVVFFWSKTRQIERTWPPEHRVFFFWETGDPQFPETKTIDVLCFLGTLEEINEFLFVLHEAVCLLWEKPLLLQ